MDHGNKGDLGDIANVRVDEELEVGYVDESQVSVKEKIMMMGLIKIRNWTVNWRICVFQLFRKNIFYWLLFLRIFIFYHLMVRDILIHLMIDIRGMEN